MADTGVGGSSQPVAGTRIGDSSLPVAGTGVRGSRQPVAALRSKSQPVANTSGVVVSSKSVASAEVGGSGKLM